MAAREVVIARAEAKRVDSGLTGAIIRNSTNELVVFLAPGSSAQQRSDWNTALQKLGVPHRIEERRELVPVDGTLRSDSQVPPFLGGHGYAATSSTKNPPPSGTFYRGCTLGFKANRNSASGSSFLLSAGHCWYNAQNPTYYAPIDAKAYYNWDNQNGGTRTGLGNLKGYWATENFDFSLIAVSNSAPKIIVNAAPTNYYRGITAVTSYAPEGTFVCQIGATSNAAHCGDVTDWDNGNHHIETDIDGVIGGDSGGPLYLPRANNKAWATGVTRTSNGTATESSNIYRYLHTFCSDCNVDVE